MNNKVAVITVAFNEPTLIGPCVRQFKNPQNPLYHLVLVSKKPWRGSAQSDFGLTGRRALDNGAESVIEGEWRTQAEQFNFGLDYLSNMGFEWAIICDADEFYTYHDIVELLKDISFAEQSSDDGIIAFNMDVYWKLPIFKIIPKQNDWPIIAIKTDKKFVDKRTSNCENLLSGRPILHHFSYVRTNEEMLKKIKSFEHSHEFDTDAWYKNKWMMWGVDTENLHPVVPEQFKKAIYSPAPQEIINNFYSFAHDPFKSA